MERLTERNEYGKAYYPYCFKENTCGGFGSSEKCDECNFNTRVCEKLAYYEDLEEQGRLIKLPCKVGDTAYHVYKEYLKDIDKWIKAIVEVEVDSFIININLLVNVSLRIGHDVFRKTLTPYKTLFFTKEEAEKALAEMGE